MRGCRCTTCGPSGPSCGTPVSLPHPLWWGAPAATGFVGNRGSYRREVRDELHTRGVTDPACTAANPRADAHALILACASWSCTCMLHAQHAAHGCWAGWSAECMTRIVCKRLLLVARREQVRRLNGSVRAMQGAGRAATAVQGVSARHSKRKTIAL